MANTIDHTKTCAVCVEIEHGWFDTVSAADFESARNGAW